MHSAQVITKLKSVLARSLAKGKSKGLQGRFLRATSGLFGLKLFGAFTRLVTSVLLARLLGADQLGVFAFALSIAIIAAIPVDIGLPDLVTRNVAVYNSLNKWSAMRGLLLRANQLVLGFSLFVMLLAASVTLGMDISGPSLYTFLAAFAALPFMALGALRRGSLVGLHQPITAQIPEAIIQPTLFIVFVGGSSLLITGPDATSTLAMTLRVISFGVAFCVGHVLLFRYLPVQVKQASASFETSAWLRGAVAFMLLGGLATLNAQAGIVMLGLSGSNVEVGIYKVVVVLSALVTFILRAVNTSLSPIIAKLHAEGDTKRLQNIVTLATRLILVCGLPASILLIFSGKWILTWLYGAEFSEGATALGILCVGQLANAATGPVGLILNMSGHERDTVNGQTVGALLNIVLAAIFIPMWGMEGAALAATCSLITWNLILVVLVRRRLGLHSTAFGGLRARRTV